MHFLLLLPHPPSVDLSPPDHPFNHVLQLPQSVQILNFNLNYFHYVMNFQTRIQCILPLILHQSNFFLRGDGFGGPSRKKGLTKLATIMGAQSQNCAKGRQ